MLPHAILAKAVEIVCAIWHIQGCFLFAAFAALRLAKFNIDEEQHTEFRGLPTPAATLFVVAMGWSVEHSGIMAGVNVWGVLVTTLVLALVMVSNLPMFSLKFKGFGWKGNELRYLFMVFSLALLLMFGVESVLLIIGTYIATSATLAAINSSKS